MTALYDLLFCQAGLSSQLDGVASSVSLLGLDQFRVMTANALDAIVLLGDSITQGGWQAGGFSQQLACKPAGLNIYLSFRTPHLSHFVRQVREEARRNQSG